MLKRYDLTLTRDGSTERIDTFVWGETRNEAYARVTDLMDEWDGWSFQLATQHTLIEGK